MFSPCCHTALLKRRRLYPFIPLFLVCVIACSGSFQETDYIQEGNRLLESGQYFKAITAFTKAIEKDPDKPIPYLGRGKAQYKLGKANEALQDLANSL